MKADETRLGPLLEGQTQYVVPYFQRSYSWGRQQWTTLYDDILELYHSGSPHGHFLGSVVLLQDKPGQSGSAPTLVIDGQQRLVTLCIFLAAVRDVARGRNAALANELQRRYLTNRAAGEEEQPKILCTYQDRAAFASVVAGGDGMPPSTMVDAYRTFKAAVEGELESGFDLERLEAVTMSQLSFVAISLDANDNPYRIFESLNAKGMPLTQGDLLRNYFFMRLPTAEHEKWHSSVWTPMQTLLGSHFDDFMRDFLVKEGETVRPDEVYQAWRKRLAPMSEEGIRHVLGQLREWSVEYDHVLHPQRETDPAVGRRLDRLATWSNTLLHSLHPFLLRLRADLSQGDIPPDQLDRVLLAAESFLVRRLFVSPPAADENQLFISLYRQVSPGSDKAESFIQSLSQPRLGWPEDGEFQEAVVRYPLFLGSHPDHRTLIFQALEESYPHRFPVNYATLEIEFVAPFLPKPEWLRELGVGDERYWKLSGTLGNFTWMTRGHSPSLRVGERKRELSKMARSGLELVRDISQAEHWTAEEIEQRSRRLAERALTVWPGPRRGAA